MGMSFAIFVFSGTMERFRQWASGSAILWAMDFKIVVFILGVLGVFFVCQSQEERAWIVACQVMLIRNSLWLVYLI